MIACYALVSVAAKAAAVVATCVWGLVEGGHGVVEQILAAGDVLLGLA